jgi:hypothetical protein
MRVTLFSIFIFLGLISYGQKERHEDYWRRIDPFFGKVIADKALKVGDFIVKANSTYIIVGDIITADAGIPFSVKCYCISKSNSI